MPTLDQLASATATSDSDELLISQSGIARKATRAQLLAGIQAEIALNSGTLLGRCSAGTGEPEQVAIGANLSLTNGTLNASASPFNVASLRTGTVPGAADLVPLGQGGNNTAVTYSQFMSGLSGIGNIDISQFLVTPTGGKTSSTLGNFAANTLSLTGGTLTGSLTLSADPSTTLHAATKHYVDTQVATTLPLSGGTLTGALSLAADPTAPLQAATKHYVDTQSPSIGLPLGGGTMTGALILSADPTLSLQAATKHYVDTNVPTSALPLSGGTLTGPLTLQANPTAALQAATKQYVDTQSAASVALSGGTMTGPLTLSASPTASLQAATKGYVDAAGFGSTGMINIRSSPYSAALNGTTDDTAAFKAAYQAAPAGSVIYVPNGVTVMQNPNNWGISLTKRVKWNVDGTSMADGTPLADAIPGGGSPADNFLPGIVLGNSGQSVAVSQTGSQSTDFAVMHNAYVVNHTGGPAAVICNTRTETFIYNSPNNYVWNGLDRLVWCGVQTPTANTPAQHVGRYVQTIRETITTNSSGQPLPQPKLWTACLEYRDTTGEPSSWASNSITIEMDWFGNGADDGNYRQVQSIVIGQHNTSGTPVEVSTVLGVWLAGGSSGHVQRVFSVNIPYTTSVLDTTNAQQSAGANAIRLAAGQSIAFEATGQNYLYFDATTATLRWSQGGMIFPVGKGIAVGFQDVYAASATLPNYIAGNIIFLVGSGSPYTITLPAANSLAAGTGFTMSALGLASVTIAPAGTDGIDNGPVTLRQNDRYHIVSDGSGTWREVFRTNSVSPHFAGSPVLPNYTVALLPASPGTGALAFATNGRKPSEAAGAGTGVEVFYDGGRWVSNCSGSQVSA